MRFFDVSTITDFEPAAAVLAEIQGWAAPLAIEVLVVGATARNIVVRHLGVQVDVVPFGGVEAPNRTITWPDDHTMTVLGFDEAWSHAAIARLPGGVEIRVPSLAAQAVLKVLAWNDRHSVDSRDAVDLATLLETRSEGDQLEELYTDHGALLERNGFDPLLAGSELLGAEGAVILGPAGRTTVHGILTDERLFDLLSAQMRGRVDRRRELLAAFAHGFRS